MLEAPPEWVLIHQAFSWSHQCRTCLAHQSLSSWLAFFPSCAAASSELDNSSLFRSSRPKESLNVSISLDGKATIIDVLGEEPQDGAEEWLGTPALRTL